LYSLLQSIRACKLFFSSSVPCANAEAIVSFATIYSLILSTSIQPYSQERSSKRDLLIHSARYLILLYSFSNDFAFSSASRKASAISSSFLFHKSASLLFRFSISPAREVAFLKALSVSSEIFLKVLCASCSSSFLYESISSCIIFSCSLSAFSISFSASEIFLAVQA
jgi:hypothetical protein